LTSVANSSKDRMNMFDAPSCFRSWWTNGARTFQTFDSRTCTIESTRWSTAPSKRSAAISVNSERFTGADWHIVNYFGEEVLASQPHEAREFLLVTPVLDRMCAPLCDAPIGRTDGAELISEIYGANLFVIPLDDERRWFRTTAVRRAEDDENRLACLCAEGYQALLAVNRGDLAVADSLAGDAESAVGQTLSESHFVAMFPALTRARLELRQADWAGAWCAATTAVERGRRGPDGWNSLRHCSQRRRSAKFSRMPRAIRWLTFPPASRGPAIAGPRSD
jgi:hypothetical protein